MTESPNLAGALAAVQAELPDITKDKTARVKTDKAQYSYRYADLANISRIVLPVLGRHGLAWTTQPTIVDGGAFVLAYRLAHAGGESIDGQYPLPDPVRSSPQAVGSAITYARRYALCSVTGVAPDDDDDDAAHAAAAHQQQRETQQRPASTNGRAEPAREEQPPAAPPHPNTVRDWALKPDRTADELDQALARLHNQYPEVAAAEVQNENGDEEQLQVLLNRRARELTAATEPDPVTGGSKPEDRRRKRMHALWNDLGYSGAANRAQRMSVCARIVGREIASTSDLTFPKEVELIIAALEDRQRAQQAEEGDGRVTPDVARQKREELEGAPA